MMAVDAETQKLLDAAAKARAEANEMEVQTQQLKLYSCSCKSKTASHHTDGYKVHTLHYIAIFSFEFSLYTRAQACISANCV
jgi:hypothetical protein